MKRWELILVLLAVFTAGLGLGIMGGRALWSLAYMTGTMHARTELVLDTQHFRDLVEARAPFRMGDYTFVPSRSQTKTVKVRIADKHLPVGGKE